MGKKNCCKKMSCDLTSSSDCTKSSIKYCCTKYPKCYCVKEKCSPIYYPNNCVGQYPCNPCNPCKPYNPCNPCNPCLPNPCFPSQCKTSYTANTSIITSNTVLNANSQNVYICNPTSSDITITLPSISSLGSCCFTKMFVISNISPSFTTTIVTNGDSLTNPSKSILSQNETITLYSVNVSGGAYWVVA